MKDITPIKEFIETNFSDIKSYKNVVKDLLILCDYLKNYSEDDMIYLIDNGSNKLSNSLDYFVKQNYPIIENGDLSKYYSDPIFLKLIDIYYKKNTYVSENSIIVSIFHDPWNKQIEEMYQKDILKYPLLSAEEEKELFARFHNGDLKAREKIIVSNLRLVYSMAHKKSGRGVDFLDLIQIGNVGLIQAVDRFDDSYGGKFSSYANGYIQGYIEYELLMMKNNMRITYRANKNMNRILTANNEYDRIHNKDASDQQLSNELNIKVDEIKHLRTLISVIYNSINLNEKIGNETETEYWETIASDVSVVDEVEAIFDKEYVEELLANSSLKNVDIDILKRRFGLPPYYVPQSLETIGKAHNCTREWIRVKEDKALAKIRNYIEIKQLGKDVKKPDYSIYQHFDPIYTSDIDYIISTFDRNNMIVYQRVCLDKVFTDKDLKQYYNIILYRMKKLMESNYYHQFKYTESIYECFWGVAVEELLEAVNDLNENDQKILMKRYRRDFNSYNLRPMYFSEIFRFYNNILPSIDASLKKDKIAKRNLTKDNK